VPFQVNRGAPAFAERQVLIAAPRERVWELLAGIDDWPRWQSGVSKARLEGPLQVGTPFRWKPGGMTVASRLAAVMAPIHIAWLGKAVGVRAYHGWYLHRHTNGTMVRTAESFDGPLPRLLRPLMQRSLNRALGNALDDLRREAETSAA
jgi:hypothetical protein